MVRRNHFRWWNVWLVALTLISTTTATSRVARADALGDFLAAYPKAAEELERHYANVAMEIEGVYHDEQDVFKFALTERVLRSGNKFLRTSTATRSAYERWPEGSVSVDGGDSSLYFSAFRIPPSPRFVFLAYGPEDDFLETVAPLKFGPVFAPFAMVGDRITGLLANKAFRPASARTVELPDGSEALRVELTGIDKENAVDSVVLTFEPTSLALREYEFSLPGTVSRGVITYAPDTPPGTPPELRRIERWEEPQGRPRRHYRDLKVTSIKHEKVPDEQLTPEAAGLTDLPARQQ